jgi:AcrR family transcriptional regulator
VRIRLLEAAARRIATDGSLTLRRVAEDAGTSTMAIYTHFGGMAELRRAVRREGFRRLADDLAQAPDAGDPLEHVVSLCLAYCRNGVTHPDLYREMFLADPMNDEDAAICAGTFEVLIAALVRAIEAGALSPADPVELATGLWVAGHGIVSLRLAGALPPDAAEGAVTRSLRDLLTAYGADPSAIERALAAA